MPYLVAYGNFAQENTYFQPNSKWFCSGPLLDLIIVDQERDQTAELFGCFTGARNGEVVDVIIVDQERDQTAELLVCFTGARNGEVVDVIIVDQERDQTAELLVCFTGARNGEVVGVHWKNWDLLVLTL